MNTEIILSTFDIVREAAKVHKLNAKWWINLETNLPLDRSKPELLALVISEFSEALEGHRKNLMDDKLPRYPMACVDLADSLIRLLDIFGAYTKNMPDQEGLREKTRSRMAVRAWDFHSRVNTFPELLFSLTCEVCRLKNWAEDVIVWPDDSVANDLADIIWMIVIVGVDNWGQMFIQTYNDKNKFNETREDHTLEHRKAEGGKKY